MNTQPLYKKSIIFGASIGTAFGALVGAITGSLSLTWYGVLYCLAWGAGIGLVTGIVVSILAVRTAGDSGGVSYGAYAGMLAGAVIGGVFGAFIPDSFRAAIISLDNLILSVLAEGRFAIGVLMSFLVCLVGTMVGSWVAGRNFIPRDVKKKG